MRAEGTAEVAPAGTITVSLHIDAASVTTKHKQRDKHLRSADFFDVDQHPTVTFTSRRVVAEGAGRLAVEGDLSAAGHSQPVAFEASVHAATLS